MDVQKMLEILKRDYGIESKEELIERFESSKGINIGNLCGFMCTVTPE